MKKELILVLLFYFCNTAFTEIIQSQNIEKDKAFYLINPGSLYVHESGIEIIIHLSVALVISIIIVCILSFSIKRYKNNIIFALIFFLISIYLSYSSDKVIQFWMYDIIGFSIAVITINYIFRYTTVKTQCNRKSFIQIIPLLSFSIAYLVGLVNYCYFVNFPSVFHEKHIHSLFGLLTAIFYSFFEEIIYRHYLNDAIEKNIKFLKKYSIIRYMIIALVFFYGHKVSLFSNFGIALIISSLVYSKIYEKSNNIFISCILHSAWNIIIFFGNQP